jgi:hypothetical protein
VCAHASRSDPSIAQRPALQDVTFPVGRERSPHDFFDMVRAAEPAACACTVPRRAVKRSAQVREGSSDMLSSSSSVRINADDGPGSVECPDDQMLSPLSSSVPERPSVCMRAHTRTFVEKRALTCVHGRMDAQAPIVDVGPRAWLEEQRLLLRDSPLGQVCLPATAWHCRRSA